MTRPNRGAVCHAHDATRSCRARWDAVVRAEFIWQDYVGWLWLHPKVDNHTPWEFCPWCGHTLPTLPDDDPLDRIRQADGFDGEDGG